MFCLGLIFPSYGSKKDPSSCSNWCLVNYEAIHSGCWKQAPFSGPLWVLGTAPYNTLSGFLLTVGSFLICMRWSVFTWVLYLQGFGVLSVQCCPLRALWPLTPFCSTHFCVHIFNLGRPLVSFWVSLPDHGENFLQVAIWVSFRAQLICPLSLKDHCPLLPGVQCLESYHRIFVVYL